MSDGNVFQLMVNLVLAGAIFSLVSHSSRDLGLETTFKSSYSGTSFITRKFDDNSRLFFYMFIIDIIIIIIYYYWHPVSLKKCFSYCAS